MGTTEAATGLSYQLTFGIIGMILLTVFIVIFFVIYQRKLLQQQLHIQKIESAHQKKMLDSNILSQEEERSRMAIELHDSIGGLLSATKLYVSNVTQELPKDKFELYKSKALLTINENIEEVRTITNDLLPQSLDRVGVVTATRHLTQKLTELKEIKVDFTSNLEIRFDAYKEKALFRIFQELINNTLKYSNATEVELRFDLIENALNVSYKENGQGFDFEALEKNKENQGFGLKSIQSRVAFLNGESEFHSTPAKGVYFNLSFHI